MAVVRVRGRGAEGSGDGRALKARARAQMARLHAPVLFYVLPLPLLECGPACVSQGSALGLEVGVTELGGIGKPAGAPTCWKRGSRVESRFLVSQRIFTERRLD